MVEIAYLDCCHNGQKGRSQRKAQADTKEVFRFAWPASGGLAPVRRLPVRSGRVPWPRVRVCWMALLTSRQFFPPFGLWGVPRRRSSSRILALTAIAAKYCPNLVQVISHAARSARADLQHFLLQPFALVTSGRWPGLHCAAHRDARARNPAPARAMETEVEEWHSPVCNVPLQVINALVSASVSGLPRSSSALAQELRWAYRQCRVLGRLKNPGSCRLPQAKINPVWRSTSARVFFSLSR